MSIAPLQNMANAPFLSSLPVSRLLLLPGSWFPVHLFGSKQVTGNGEFLLLVGAMFIIYGIASWTIRRDSLEVPYARTLGIILSGTVIAGFLFVFAPAFPSRDVFIYADYGRAIVAHSTNPYFVPPSHVSPYDPITRLDSWNSVPAAYGPLWLTICSCFALFLGDDPVRYIFAFRLLGLTAHVLNTLLVIAILRRMGRSPRTVVAGALLYGCNPLVVMESCLGPHNDALMVTLMLSGVWLMLRAKRLTTPKGYLLPVVMMSLAMLIKFTSAPLLLLFLVLIARRTLLEGSVYTPLLIMRRWRVIGNVAFASIVSILTVLLFYGPFWVGHSISAIVHSFVSPPSSSLSENSLLRVLIEWEKLHGLPTRVALFAHLFHVLSQHGTWTAINAVVLMGSLLLGGILIWRNATLRSVTFAALFTFEAILLTTPWLYSWYVLWIVGLAAILLGSGAFVRPFIGLAFTFSVTAFFTYLDPHYLLWITPGEDWLAPRFVLTVLPPLLTFVALLLFNRPLRREPAIPVYELQRESVPSH